MQLLINDHPVDFAIEQECTVKDVMSSVYNWASERKLIFSGAIVDGVLYQPDTAPETPIHEIKNINCYVQSVGDVVIDSIKEGIAYCNRAQQYLKGKSLSQLTDSEFTQLHHGIEWIVSVLQSVLHMLGLEREDVRFKDMTVQQYIESIQLLQQTIANDKSSVEINKINELFHDVTTLFRVLLCSDALKHLIVQSVDSPDVLFKTLLDIKTMVPKQVDNLEAIASLYQKGKDNEALEIIHTLIDFLYLYMRTCYQISPVFGINLAEVMHNNQSLEEHNIRLQDMLSEIVEIMENNDIVSLSDILEYELKPLIGELDNYLNIILQQIKS
ncbi:MAG: hypothetical protein N3F66_12705 [Spirochaetes bacterium]|nr:hypothetical protein [Spirochaetota bacterium]